MSFHPFYPRSNVSLIWRHNAHTRWYVATPNNLQRIRALRKSLPQFPIHRIPRSLTQSNHLVVLQEGETPPDEHIKQFLHAVAVYNVADRIGNDYAVEC